ncbi:MULTISPECIES: amino acid ABC transporter substrate-binding protein [unclassified Neisseria]|uniref:amino acid ABC transporter substrate-binding protein n=1 Tax=unclassified Neisseria TaxID=2623750 RepID=UPI00266614AC|nr:MULTISPECIES: amino acid ABC transporter substrate-binding protein [unclassified Neisseria]MDO1509270.1 amino acid ABC transporter substrate-binding protein [Neisseria sp. MVDL19-042950]MDO1515451.1 amino acid ABC transporter substrate-binding protein [Neisseria sp. MVDL18-041461]MDO1562811.1 amino acid ABC transporter substrate-binding protein [Neisseria sp. MVDL20-010259]
MLKKFVLGSMAAFVLAACGNGGGNASSASAPASAAPETQVAGSLLERINNKGTITVGTEGTYAPFTYHDESGKLTGYDVEVTRAVAEKLGVKVDFKETQWDAMLAGLKAERFDIVANQVSLTTPERRATFDKSAEYSYSGPMAVDRKDDNRIKTLADVKGLSAAQTLSSNYGEMAQKAEAKIIPVDGMAQALALVQQKRADFTFNDSLALLDYLKKNPNSGLKTAWTASAEEKLGAGFIVNKNNDEALAKISDAVEELRADGTLKKLGEQFFGVDVSVK